MRRLIITAIDKNPRDDRHEHIKRFGGYDLATLQHWEASFDEAILMAKNPYVEFFVRGTRGLIPVGLFLSAYRNLCLRSDPNGVDADNLLSLPPLTALNPIELANALMRHGNQASNGIGLVRSTNRLSAISQGAGIPPRSGPGLINAPLSALARGKGVFKK